MTEELLHLAEADLWDAARATGTYEMSTRGKTLREEGFIHCSPAQQWPATVERLYADADELLLLHIDEALLAAPLVYEQVGNATEPFPHVYGPINLDAVVEVERLR